MTRILNREYEKGQIYALQARLREIPGDLHQLFKGILTRDSNDRDECLLCIQFMLCTTRPLSVEELYFGFMAGLPSADELSGWDPSQTTTGDMEKFILNSSKGVTKSKNAVIRFIHGSVRDYLLKSQGIRHLQPSITSGDFRKGKSRSSKTGLLGNDTFCWRCGFLRQPVGHVVVYPFLEYLLDCLLYHAELAESENTP